MVEVSAAVLAGGSSRRMGTDKRALVVDGVPLLRRAVLTTSAISRDVMVVAPESRTPPPSLLEGLDYRLVLDRSSLGGPLAGIEAALAIARFELVVVVPTDMPRLTPELLRLIADRLAASRSTAAALVRRGALQPFPLAIRRSAHHAVDRALQRGPRSMRELLSTVAIQAIPEVDWRRADTEDEALFNANRPSDVSAALSSASEGG